MKPLPLRPRRNRKCASIRALVRETSLSPSDLIQPLFLHAGNEDQPIASMPGCTRWSLPGLLQQAEKCQRLGIPAIALFPAIDETLKSSDAQEAFNPEGLIPRAIKLLKNDFPDLVLITDVALDPYNSDGHDGLVKNNSNGITEILNDETIEVLARQAICQAQAGSDVVAPSDMMDGRIGAIRAALDQAELSHTSILAYTAKYASAFYGPFRGALDSSPKNGDKKTYQMDPANSREALRELHLDQHEGADILMVKPAGAYLDIIQTFSQNSYLPIAAYQVSGEYLMIESAAKAGWLNREAAIFESLTSIKRAGANMILTYFASEIAEKL